MFSKHLIPARPAAVRGFTLMELLVAMVIIGIIVGGASLALREPVENKVREQAERLAALITLAREEAILQSRELAVGFWEDGYGFYELGDTVDENGERVWLELEDDLLRQRDLPPETRLKLRLEGREIVMKAIPVEKPQVFILSSGEVSPFTLTLSYQQDIEYTVTSDALGNIELENPDEKDEFDR